MHLNCREESGRLMPFGSSKSAHPEDETPKQPPPPAGNGQTEREPYKRMSFRPDYLDDTAPHEGAPATAVAEIRPLPQGDAFFVSVTRDGASEIHRFDSAVEAQAFVEEQLGDGLPQEDVTAFSGRRLGVKGSHRPLVTRF